MKATTLLTLLILLLVASTTNAQDDRPVFHNGFLTLPGFSGLPSGPAFNDWIRVPGDARDIDVGADGTVWVLGGNVVENRDFGFFNDDDIDYDFGLWELDEFGWLEYPGSGIRLDVDPDGYPWLINSDLEIWRLTPYGWDRIPGRANDIGIGADGSVWVIGSNEREGGYGIYTWTGFDWARVRGSARQVSVGPDGNPWVVNRNGEIYTRW